MVRAGARCVVCGVVCAVCCVLCAVWCYVCCWLVLIQVLLCEGPQTSRSFVLSILVFVLSFILFILFVNTPGTDAGIAEARRIVQEIVDAPVAVITCDDANRLRDVIGTLYRL